MLAILTALDAWVDHTLSKGNRLLQKPLLPRWFTSEPFLPTHTPSALFIGPGVGDITQKHAFPIAYDPYVFRKKKKEKEFNSLNSLSLS